MADFIFEEHKGLLVGQAHGARYERANPTENDVTVPPAFLITDKDGAAWTFGYQYTFGRDGKTYEFTVLRNDVDTGEVANKIAYVAGVVTIWGSHYGRKRWSGRSFI